MNKDLLSYTVKSLSGRKTRTFLTVLSILIGIMAIFTLISFGQGLSKYVNDISKEMGTDKLMISLKTLAMIPEKGLMKEDLDYIKKIKGVQQASAFMAGSIKIQPDSNTNPKYVYMSGVSTEKEDLRLTEEIMTVSIMEGRDLKKGDKLKAVLGAMYKEPGRVFDKPIEVGQKVLINDLKVEVIGFYEPIGNPNDDQGVIMSFEGFKEVLNKSEEYTYIIVRAEKNVRPADLSEKITQKLGKFRGQQEGKEDFSVDTFEEMIAQFGTILSVLNMVLVMIALVSVVISAINIMNTMYTSVLERTKDIGIMKAIGAKNSDILAIFVIESGLLGLIGGTIGVIIGYFMSSTGGKIAAAAGYALLKPTFPATLIIGCILFATLVGAVSGLAPAIQGSKQKPVDSLRYE